MSCYNTPLKPFFAWVIVSYRWNVPYTIKSTIRKTRKDAIKAVTDMSGWPWKKHYRMGMRAVKMQVVL